mmetsp:Transcript_18664/g.39114  ORF Transcript_18664/g.39114 Transcript_18664/m.39114 type:complete len:220 (+) Transcript_18664:1438-2097(+)
MGRIVALVLSVAFRRLLLALMWRIVQAGGGGGEQEGVPRNHPLQPHQCADVARFARSLRKIVELATGQFQHSSNFRNGKFTLFVLIIGIVAVTVAGATQTVGRNHADAITRFQDARVDTREGDSTVAGSAAALHVQDLENVGQRRRMEGMTQGDGIIVFLDLLLFLWFFLSVLWIAQQLQLRRQSIQGAGQIFRHAIQHRLHAHASQRRSAHRGHNHPR